MMTIYKASTVHSAANHVLSAVREGNGRSVVIAPDPFTLAVEMTIAEKLGKQGTFEVEVMSFARLASVILGKKIKKCLSPSGSVMLMEKVVSRCEESLRVYRRAARKAGFASEIYAAITAIRNSGVSPTDLRLAADKLQGYVRDKTLDIALLYEAYLEELNREHTDSTTRLEALVREIEEDRADFGDVNVYLVDHVDLNSKQVEVLTALMKKAKSLSVAVADPGGQGNRRIYPNLLNKLRRAAKAAGVSVEEVAVPNLLDGAKKTLSEELFAYGITEGRSDGIFLGEGKDPEEEVTWLATEISRLVREEGSRYRDVAVITPAFEDYLPYMERIFPLYDIPLFSDARYPLSGSDVFRHILCAFELALSSLDRTKVKKYLSHAMFLQVSEEEKALFFDYIDMSGVNGSYFRKPFELFADRPEYPVAERVREILLKEVGSILDLPERATFASYVAALRDFLRENAFDDKIAIYGERVYNAGLRKEAEIIRRTPAAMMDLLATLEELREEDEIDLRGFVLALTSGAEQVKLAALPVSLDCVYFAPVERAMYAPIGSLFVIGAEEGIFPLEGTKEGILGEREYAAWQRLDVVIENTGVEELAASRFHALQLLLRGERLYLTHLASNAASVCMKQIAVIFSLPIVKIADRLAAYPIETRIPTRAVAERLLVEFSRRSREGLLTETEASFALCIAELLGKTFPLSEEEERDFTVTPKVFFRSGETAVSEIESYYRCPFLHFVRYGLQAQEREVAEYDSRDIGNIAHECMCRFVKELIRKGEIEISGDEARSRAEEIARDILSRPKYKAIARSEGEQFVTREIRRCREIAVTVKDQIAHSDFRPVFLEKRFGKTMGGDRDFPPFALGDVTLRGAIDRVDVLHEEIDGEKRDYVVAIDYKTGKRDIATSKLYLGEKVQLQLYLSLMRKAGFLPVAALYADLATKIKSTKEPFLLGPILSDPYFVGAIEGDHGVEKGKYTGLTIKKDGSLDPLKDRTMSEAELDAILRYAEAVARNAVSEIEEGYAFPSALHKDRYGACESCKARGICRAAERYSRPEETATTEDILRLMTEEV